MVAIATPFANVTPIQEYCASKHPPNFSLGLLPSPIYCHKCPDPNLSSNRHPLCSTQTTLSVLQNSMLFIIKFVKFINICRTCITIYRGQPNFGYGFSFGAETASETSFGLFSAPASVVWAVGYRNCASCCRKSTALLFAPSPR